QQYIRLATHLQYSAADGSSLGYISRKAAAIGSRAARIAGKRPPIRPMAAAQRIAPTSSRFVTVNAKATWLKVCQLMVVALKPVNARGGADAPTTPRPSARSSDSSITERTTGLEPKPRARSVAISRVRAATALYMVFSAPNKAPRAMRAVIDTPNFSTKLV